MAHLIFRSMRAVQQCHRAPDSLQGTGGDAAAPEAPALSMNCLQLAAYCSVSTRTVRAYIDALMKMGAIARKAWHGSRANFELWINPKYLWATAPTAGDTGLEALHIGALLARETTNFPVNVACETLETKKLEHTRGDKLVTRTSPAVAVCREVAPRNVVEPATRATLSGNTGLQLPAGVEIAGGGAGGAAPVPCAPAEGAAEPVVDKGRRWPT